MLGAALAGGPVGRQGWPRLVPLLAAVLLGRQPLLALGRLAGLLLAHEEAVKLLGALLQRAGLTPVTAAGADGVAGGGPGHGGEVVVGGQERGLGGQVTQVEVICMREPGSTGGRAGLERQPPQSRTPGASATPAGGDPRPPAAEGSYKTYRTEFVMSTMLTQAVPRPSDIHAVGIHLQD